MDIHGNTRLITKDEEKVNALGNFFSSVFTDEVNTQAPNTYNTFSSTSITNIDINEQIILNKLNKLDVTKFPGPDGLHPCILYEMRNEIAFPLKILPGISNIFQVNYSAIGLDIRSHSGNTQKR